MTSEVFLDTSCVVALAVATDQYHGKATTLARGMQVARTRLVTTEAVLLEVGNSLARLRFRPAAVQLLQSLTNDSQVEVEPITTALFRRGLQLFEARPDKEWGLVDCVSFVVMQDRGLTEALTSDEHFEQAGFVALLLRE